jgi:hypothetical protein
MVDAPYRIPRLFERPTEYDAALAIDAIGESTINPTQFHARPNAPHSAKAEGGFSDTLPDGKFDQAGKVVFGVCKSGHVNFLALAGRDCPCAVMVICPPISLSARGKMKLSEIFSSGSTVQET